MLREPILWFIVVGAFLFAAESYFTTEREVLVVDEGVRNRLASLWQAQMGSPATEQQLGSLIDSWVREEVMLREALRLNLDRDDTIIRRRLVQKLEFLAEDINGEIPDSETLEGFYRLNIEKYSEPRRYSFSQIYFSEQALATEQLLTLDSLSDWKSLGEVTMLNSQYFARSKRDISNILGGEFAGVVDEFLLREWAGPFKSSFGYHIVRLERVDEPAAVPIASIEMKVLADYQESQKRQKLKDYFESLLEQTNIEHR